LGGDIEWNFGKFIINRYGDPVNRFTPKTEPDAPEVIQAIENCL
jgi:glutathione peroxidase